MNDVYNYILVVYAIVFIGIATLFGILDKLSKLDKLDKPVPIFTNEQAIEAMDCLAERGE